MPSVWVLTDRYLCARVCVNVTFFADAKVMMRFTGGGLNPVKVRGELFFFSYFLVCFWFRFFLVSFVGIATTTKKKKQMLSTLLGNLQVLGLRCSKVLLKKKVASILTRSKLQATKTSVQPHTRRLHNRMGKRHLFSSLNDYCLFVCIGTTLGFRSLLPFPSSLPSSPLM